MVEVFGCNIKGEWDENRLFDVAFSFLPKRRQDRIRAMQSRDDAVRTLTGDLMIRELAGIRLGIDPRDVGIEEDPLGKPWITGQEMLHFNISHSGRWVLCAIGDEPVGVDVEFFDPTAMEAARLVFNDRECRWIFQGNGTKAVDRFFVLWTLKESYMKFTGLGLGLAPLSFEIDVKQDRIQLTGEGVHKVRLECYRPDETHRAALCTTNSLPGKIIPWTLGESRIYRGEDSS